MPEAENLNSGIAKTTRPTVRRRKSPGYVNRGQPNERSFKRPITLARFIEAVGADYINTPLEVLVAASNSDNAEMHHLFDVRCWKSKGKRRLILSIELSEHRLVKKRYLET